MFLNLLGGRKDARPAEENLPSIQVTRVVPINDETKESVRALLIDKGTIADDNPHVVRLKGLALRDVYHRAGGYLPIRGGEERASMWVQKDALGAVVPDTMVMLRERRADGVYQPSAVMSGEKAMYAMIFQPPCCEGIESVLVGFRLADKRFSHKVVQSAVALKQGVADYFRAAVTIGPADNDMARTQLDETYNHLLDIEHKCGAGSGFPPAYRNG